MCRLSIPRQDRSELRVVLDLDKDAILLTKVNQSKKPISKIDLSSDELAYIVDFVSKHLGND